MDRETKDMTPQQAIEYFFNHIRIQILKAQAGRELSVILTGRNESQYDGPEDQAYGRNEKRIGRRRAQSAKTRHVPQ